MLNKKYQSQQTAIASYDWIDIAEGTGIVALYAAGGGDDSATLYFLTKNTSVISQTEKGEYWEAGGLNVTTVSDIDFDLSPFNHPTTIRGTILAAVAGGMTTAGSNNSATLYVTITVRKVNDAGESDIASEQSASHSWVTGDSLIQHFLTRVVIPKTHFKKGEILRINVAHRTARGNGVGSATPTGSGFAFQPSNNNTEHFTVGGNVYSSRTVFYVPFEIDL